MRLVYRFATVRMVKNPAQKSVNIRAILRYTKAFTNMKHYCAVLFFNGSKWAPSKLSATLEPGAPQTVMNMQPISSQTQTANDAWHSCIQYSTR